MKSPDIDHCKITKRKRKISDKAANNMRKKSKKSRQNNSDNNYDSSGSEKLTIPQLSKSKEFVDKSELRNAIKIFNQKTTTESKRKQTRDQKCKKLSSELMDNLQSPMKYITPHSYTFIAYEMRKCVLAHDWDNLTRLLMIFYNTPNLKNLRLRYAIINLFNNPADIDNITLEEFLTKCISCPPENQEDFIRRLLKIKN